MKHTLFALLWLIAGYATTVHAQHFDEFFTDATLRLDYTFAGDANHQAIYVDELSRSPHWYGRRHHLDSLPLAGNGRIIVSDKATGKVVYKHSFSTLFQEWLATDEAKRCSKSFENVFLIPFPRNKVNIHVELNDYHNRVMAALDHEVDPTDILIRHTGERCLPYTTLHPAADSTRCINIAFVAEGYQADEMPHFIADAEKATRALFAHRPFSEMSDRFNIIAVKSVSEDKGTSIPHKNIWLNTAIRSHFDTFYSNRYLTTLHLKQLHNLLTGLPYEHIIVLVNTAEYGGGGIYNSYNLSYTQGTAFEPVVVHEFGHSFGGLGDEYAYGDSDPMYFSTTEPWEPNITTLCDFTKKWQNLIDEGKASLVEGGGYLTKGVYRGADNCRMRTNEEKEFCAVCRQALTRLILFYTEE